MLHRFFNRLNRNNGQAFLHFIRNFGEILHMGWTLKKTLAAGISNPLIDSWYDKARCYGAIGGKLLGAGGGGFLLLYAHPDCHAEICRALPELKPMTFQFAPQGSKIIFIE